MTDWTVGQKVAVQPTGTFAGPLQGPFKVTGIGPRLLELDGQDMIPIEWIVPWSENVDRALRHRKLKQWFDAGNWRLCSLDDLEKAYRVLTGEDPS